MMNSTPFFVRPSLLQKQLSSFLLRHPLLNPPQRKPADSDLLEKPSKYDSQNSPPSQLLTRNTPCDNISNSLYSWGEICGSPEIWTGSLKLHKHDICPSGDWGKKLYWNCCYKLENSTKPNEGVNVWVCVGVCTCGTCIANFVVSEQTNLFGQSRKHN